MEHPIRISVIGAGSRAVSVVKNLLLEAQGGVQVAAVFDPNAKHAEEALRQWENNALTAETPSQAVQVPGVEWVMIFSPNAFHKEHILLAFAAGKHVFTEKPLATTIADCVEIYKAAQAHPELYFSTGFVLRYSPLYRKAKTLLSSGKLGRILSVEACENIKPRHGGYIMTDWRRHSALAGPHLLEKCCHDLDMLNYLIHSLPRRIAGFGRLSFFIPENEFLMKKYPRGTFEFTALERECFSPFTADKDLIDTQVGILEYRNGVNATFQATMSNAIPVRRMYFSCSEGTMELELYTMTLRYRLLGDEGETVINFDGDHSGHGGGDSFIMKELYETMLHHHPVACSADEGLDSAVSALLFQQAIDSGRVVNCEDVWKQLQR